MKLSKWISLFGVMTTISVIRLILIDIFGEKDVLLVFGGFALGFITFVVADFIQFCMNRKKGDGR